MKSAPSHPSRSDADGARRVRPLPQVGRGVPAEPQPAGTFSAFSRPIARATRARLPRRTRRAGFTLVEILASLLMMAIVVPVAMEGMSIASRAGLLGQRKAAAMRVAERLLEELIAEANTQQTTDSGTLADGEFTYPWTMRTENWSADAMQQMTVTVTFTLQGNRYEVSAATLLPAAGTTATGTETLPAL
jgi:prepilin-type N-terminal cleavage/methylation domain-containing protein